jgi:hypothetical protein
MRPLFGVNGSIGDDQLAPAAEEVELDGDGEGREERVQSMNDDVRNHILGRRGSVVGNDGEDDEEEDDGWLY